MTSQAIYFLGVKITHPYLIQQNMALFHLSNASLVPSIARRQFSENRIPVACCDLFYQSYFKMSGSHIETHAIPGVYQLHTQTRTHKMQSHTVTC